MGRVRRGWGWAWVGFGVGWIGNLQNRLDWLVWKGWLVWFGLVWDVTLSSPRIIVLKYIWTQNVFQNIFEHKNVHCLEQFQRNMKSQNEIKPNICHTTFTQNSGNPNHLHKKQVLYTTFTQKANHLHNIYTTFTQKHMNDATFTQKTGHLHKKTSAEPIPTQAQPVPTPAKPFPAHAGPLPNRYET